MKLRYLPSLIALLSILAFSSCKKDGFNSLSDSLAEVPVMVSNVYDYRPGPTVKASKLEDRITITLEIPANTGRKIKEVVKIAVQATGNFTAIYTGTAVGTGPTGLWTATPIPVNASTYTFTTTFAEFRTRAGFTAAINSNAILGRDFYFMLRLDNDQEVYPMSVRVFVVD